MESSFRIEGNIMTMRERKPICMVHHKSMDAPEKHRLHLNHDYLELYVFISGNHQYIVEDSMYSLKRGDMIIINPREVHKALPLGEGMYERFYFLINDRTFDDMHFNPLATLMNRPAGKGNLISFDDDTREKVLKMLYQISDCFAVGRDEQLRALSIFLGVLDEISRFLQSGELAAGGVAHTPQLLRSVLAYVDENTATIQTTTQIAEVMGVTPQYLSGYFSRQIGTTLKTYIQAKRIGLAKELLDKGADVTEACYDCGFNDCSYFIRIFKKYVGVTPLSYKQGK